MALEKVWSRHFLSIFWDDELECVIMKWSGFARDDEFRDGLNRGLQLLSEKRARLWLADMRGLGAVTREDQDWSNSNWFPRAVKQGLRFLAMIAPGARHGEPDHGFSDR